jgi:hypothetical protein
MKEAYRCKEKDCDCWVDELDVRHCPTCGEVYMYENEHPEEPCQDCEEETEAKAKLKNT